MSGRLRTSNYVSPLLRQRYGQIKIAFTFAGLIGATWLIYDFIGSVKIAKAELMHENKVQISVLDGFSGRNKITINPSALEDKGVIKNMPVLVSLRSDDLRISSEGGMISSRDGNDILFTSADGKTLIPFQLERYDPFTGKLTAWVRPESISGDTAASAIYLYYGNTDAVDFQSKETFGNPFAAVWHFNGNFQTSGPSLLTGDYKGVKDEEGRFAGGKSFFAYNKTLSVFQPAPAMQFGGNITVSAWVKLSGLKEEQYIFTNASGNGGCNLYIDKEWKLVFEIYGKNGKSVSTANADAGVILEKEKWFQVCAVYSVEKDSLFTYVNGAKDREVKAGFEYAAGQQITIGADSRLKSGFFNGIIDELRIANAARDNDYIAVSYASESDPEQFLKINGEEIFSASPLLAVINSFEASVNTSHVSLTWQTASESNLDYFTIERSADGKIFQKVNNKFGYGNSDEKRNYFLLDPAPVYGNAYYRLRYTSFKGESDVSNMLSVHYEPAASALEIRSVEPNPFKSGFSVVYKSLKEEPMTVKLTSLTGKIVYSDSVNPETGKDNLFEYRDHESLNPGIYFLNFSQANEQRTVKLIKSL